MSGPNIIDEGDTLQLVCEVLANPLPEIVWLKRNDGTVIVIQDNSARLSISVSYSLREAEYTSTLTLNTTIPSDGGEYVCEASNSVAPSLTFSASNTLHITGC